MPGRCCSSPSRCWSGWSTARPRAAAAACWSAAIAGWWFGFGYFLSGLYWVGYAFLVDAKTFGWLLPFAVAGLPAYLAHLHRARRSRWRGCSGCAGRCALIALAVALTVAEWLRGHLLTGFPWNTFGYALTEPLALAQSVSLVGIWGLTFLARRGLREPRPCWPTNGPTRRRRGGR